MFGHGSFSLGLGVGTRCRGSRLKAWCKGLGLNTRVVAKSAYHDCILAILFFVLLAVMIVEGYLIVVFIDAFGGWYTIGLILLTSMAGAALVRREGLSVLRRAQRSLDRGEIPANELINGLLLLVGAALMLTPGFFTAGIGLLLLLPPTRAVVREVLKHRFAGRVTSTGGVRGSGTRFGRWTDVRATDVTDVGEASYGDRRGEAIELGSVANENDGDESASTDESAPSSESA